MSQVQITKQSIIKADGTTSTNARAQADGQTVGYNYDHSDFTIGFLELDGQNAKIYDTAIEANQFYEI